MFCFHCGKEVDEADTFCPYCGANLTTKEPIQSAPQPIESAPQPVQAPPAPAKKNALPIVGFSLACAAIVLVIASYFVSELFVLTLPCCIVGLILSIIGIVKSKQLGYKAGKSLAIAGIVLSAVTLLAIVVLIILAALAVVFLFSWLFVLLGL